MFHLITILAVHCCFYVAHGNALNPNYKIEMINERSELGEGPFWDKGQQRLYWVDMRNMWINSYSPDTGHLAKATIESDKTPVTFVIRVKGTTDKFAVGLKGSVALMEWDGRSNVTVKPMEFLDLEDPSGKSRCNDAKVDPYGRLWVGTMGAQTKSDPNGNQFEANKGNLYRIDNDGSKHRMVKLMQIPNGLDWSLGKNDHFYLVDSLTYMVYEYKCDDSNGTLDKGIVLYNLKENGLVGRPNSLPDGMTIDEEGMLWVSVYGAGKVIRIDPALGRKVFELKLPGVLQPTSVCFGGKQLATLFVTSAHVDWTEQFEQEYPKSGYTFMVSGLGVRGAEPSRSVELPAALVARCCDN